jgi:hypothetical protein
MLIVGVAALKAGMLRGGKFKKCCFAPLHR